MSYVTPRSRLTLITLAHSAVRAALAPVAVGLAALAVTLGAVAPASATVPASAAPAPAVPAPPHDRLTVTVRHAGVGRDGTYALTCHPASGSHPDAGGACAAVERNTHWGSDPFAPVPDGSVCTMQYGGPATAHVTGVWAGRPVDATYDRANGCEIARWNRMVPLLPDLGG
ncbi:SSI family serine proteinase inhibitor [Streptomyces sp. NPDC026672]|uniref:SSI family serine proteinase inhibitor n=1 Tax=unclassified Streptomyces TaxID=2593676 RepID=UPI0033D7F7F0